MTKLKSMVRKRKSHPKTSRSGELLSFLFGNGVHFAFQYAAKMDPASAPTPFQSYAALLLAFPFGYLMPGLAPEDMELHISLTEFS